MENIKTDFGYLGIEFQYRLIKQLLVDHKFSEEIISILSPNYFQDRTLKLIVLEIKSAYEKNESIPNINTLKIRFTEKVKNNEIESEFIQRQITKISEIEVNDSDYITELAKKFCKQQELVRGVKEIEKIIERGNLDDYDNCVDIMRHAIQAGDTEDNDSDVLDGIDGVLSENFRNPIPTGISLLDEYMNGGLSRGELAVLLAPYGVGKTTFAVKVANTAYNLGNNVLQIFFEDTKEIIKRKHIACWTGIPLDELTERREEAKERLITISERENNGVLKLKRFPSDGTTINRIRQYIKKKISSGLKPDMLIIDYIDCVETSNTITDINVAQGKVMRELEAMASEFNVATWTFVQGNRSSIKADVVEGDQMGGSIKRGQIAHVLISAAKSLQQKEMGTANMAILKSRIGKDGVIFENIVFNNKTVDINISKDDNPMSFMDKKGGMDSMKQQELINKIYEESKKQHN